MKLVSILALSVGIALISSGVWLTIAEAQDVVPVTNGLCVVLDGTGCQGEGAAFCSAYASNEHDPFCLGTPACEFCTGTSNQVFTVCTYYEGQTCYWDGGTQPCQLYSRVVTGNCGQNSCVCSGQQGRLCSATLGPFGTCAF